MHIAARSGRTSSSVVLGLWAACSFTTLTTASASAAAADTWPARPIRLLVGFPPGGAVDLTARALAAPVSERIKQQIVVDNRGGAHGNIAAETAARAAPDGYTLLLGTISILAINPAIYKQVPFDPLKDFAPITKLVSVSNVVVAHPSVGVSTMKELIEVARKKPGALTYASSGLGSPGHLAAELMKTLARIEMLHVPYKGGGPAMTDLLAGQVNTMFATVPTAAPHIRSGKLKALAVTNAKRSGALPDVPTMNEATGLSFEADNWYGVVAPARTPRPIIDRLNTEFHAALKLAPVRDRLASQGLEPAPNTPEAFNAELRREIAKWAKVARDSGARVE